MDFVLVLHQNDWKPNDWINFHDVVQHVGQHMNAPNTNESGGKILALSKSLAAWNSMAASSSCLELAMPPTPGKTKNSENLSHLCRLWTSSWYFMIFHDHHVYSDNDHITTKKNKRSTDLYWSTKWERKEAEVWIWNQALHLAQCRRLLGHHR